MLNQHRHLAVPLTDWLRIGDCVLDLPRREIACPQRAQPLRITLKTQQVLMALVSQRGRVVSREALIEWVWPDTLPTDDVLTQAIAQLRKAFCEDRDAPRYLETIAKGGYRLLAPIRWLDGPEIDAPSPACDASDAATPAIAPMRGAVSANDAIEPASPRRRRGVLVGAGVALAAIAATGAWLFTRGAPERTATSAAASTAQRGDAQPLPLRYQSITSLPGNESWPSVSPDGSQVAYSVYAEDGATLMVQTTSPVPARALTSAAPGRSDVMPAWSPDGRQLLFTRLGSDSDSDCKLMLMPSSGGEARTLADCVGGMMPTYSWHPDARHLVARGVVTPAASATAIQVLDLAGGDWTPLRYEKGARDIDISPVYSPDGQWIAFQRNISLGDLWRVPAAGGRPQRLTRLKINLYGFAWTPDSRRIIFAGYGADGPGLLELTVANGKLRRFDTGEFDAMYPGIALKAPSMAFMLNKSESALYRLPLPHAGDAAQSRAPETVFPSTGLDLLPAVAPDGRQIAFYSSRSAQLGVWWGEPDRPESLRWIEGVSPIARYAPVWSSDSRRMLVVGQVEGRAHLYEIVPASGQVRTLPIPLDSLIRAEYLPDPARLLVVADQGEGRLGMILYDRSRTPWRVLATLDDVVYTSVDAARRRIVFTRPQQPGLWQSDLDLGRVAAIAKRPAPGAPSSRRLVLKPDGMWLAASDERCGLRWTSLEGQAPPRCLLKEALGVTSFSYDSVHDRLYYSTEKDESTDIGWAPVPAPSGG